MLKLITNLTTAIAILIVVPIMMTVTVTLEVIINITEKLIKLCKRKR